MKTTLYGKPLILAMALSAVLTACGTATDQRLERPTGLGANSGAAQTAKTQPGRLPQVLEEVADAPMAAVPTSRMLKREAELDAWRMPSAGVDRENYRITSYNVCYTKLLRVDTEGGDRLLGDRVDAVVVDDRVVLPVHPGRRHRNNFV